MTKRIISKESFKDRDIGYHDPFAVVRALDDRTLTIDTMNIQERSTIKEGTPAMPERNLSMTIIKKY